MSFDRRRFRALYDKVKEWEGKRGRRREIVLLVHAFLEVPCAGRERCEP